MDSQNNQQSNWSQRSAHLNKKHSLQEIQCLSHGIKKEENKDGNSKIKQSFTKLKRPKISGSKVINLEDSQDEKEDDIRFLHQFLDFKRFQDEGLQVKIEWIKRQIEEVIKTQKLEDQEIEQFFINCESVYEFFQNLQKSNKKLFNELFDYYNKNINKSLQLYKQLQSFLNNSKQVTEESNHLYKEKLKLIYEKYYFCYQEYKHAIKKQLSSLYSSARQSYKINLIQKKIKNEQNEQIVQEISQDNNPPLLDEIIDKDNNQNENLNDLIEKKNNFKIKISIPSQYLTNTQQQSNERIETSIQTNKLDEINIQNEGFLDEIQSKQYFNNVSSQVDCQQVVDNQNQLSIFDQLSNHDSQFNQDFNSAQKYLINSDDQSQELILNLKDIAGQNQKNISNQFLSENQSQNYQVQKFKSKKDSLKEIKQIDKQNINNFSNSTLNRLLKGIPSINLDFNNQSEQIQLKQDMQPIIAIQCDCQLYQEQVIDQLQNNLSFLRQQRQMLSDRLEELKQNSELNIQKLELQKKDQQKLNVEVQQYDNLIFNYQNNSINKFE